MSPVFRVRAVALAVMAVLSMASFAAAPDDQALRSWADDAWRRVMTRFHCEKTGGIYACEPKDVSPASDFPGGLLKVEAGYGAGLEDCAIFGGVALSGLLDKYEVTHLPEVRRDASRIARGLMNLASAHPYRGFVARGLCVEDGTSICRLSSRDQVTHWAHGLARYFLSGLATDGEKAEIRLLFTEVSERMLRNVTEANGWNFLQADGTMDPRGVCKMRRTYPHEAARLAMLYALAWLVTGDEKWRGLYEDLREEALDGSCALATAPDSLVRGMMPDYSLMQMNTSLEALLWVERDEGLRARIVRAMSVCAGIAAARAPVRRGNETRYLCGCAELHLAQLMTPARAFAYTQEQRDLLASAIVHVPVERATSCRAVHLFAAYWRMRRVIGGRR